MATQLTQDALPNESPRDVKSNAEKINNFFISMGWIYTNRFGPQHWTIEGINYIAQQAMAAFGYVILTGKTFTTDAIINNPKEVLLYTADREYYKWTAYFASGGKVSTPASTGGLGLGHGLASVMLRCVAISHLGVRLYYLATAARP